jgi:hypothetical protein
MASLLFTNTTQVTFSDEQTGDRSLRRRDEGYRIGAALRGLLADVFALNLKTKNFHRHMSGPHFAELRSKVMAGVMAEVAGRSLDSHGAERDRRPWACSRSTPLTDPRTTKVQT